MFVTDFAWINSLAVVGAIIYGMFCIVIRSDGMELTII